MLLCGLWPPVAQAREENPVWIWRERTTRRTMNNGVGNGSGRSTMMTGVERCHHQRNDDDDHNHHQQHPSPFSYECTSDNYDRAVAWCHEIINSGQQHSMALFSLHSFHTELASASQRFDTPFESLHSLFRNVHVPYMKRASHALRSSTMRHVKSYLNGCSILDLAKKANCPPTLMARLIVENVVVSTTTNQQQNTSNVTKSNSAKFNSTIEATHKKKFVSEALRYPEKNLGCASTSILPEYLFSENARGRRNKREEGHDIQNDTHDDDSRQIPLSRLSLEVREAVDSDPMYGKKLAWRKNINCRRAQKCLH